MPPTPTPSRRIVLQQVHGANAGLWHILGTDDELRGGTDNTVTIPQSVDHVDLGDHEATCEFVRETGRYLLYREATVAADQREAAK